mmetsp:Transcript_242/g.768  ORF Transcript_242/g.768 Transcript_242/m.768 type:complete len:474 (-) Transcript_242:258-1679(-)
MAEVQTEAAEAPQRTCTGDPLSATNPDEAVSIDPNAVADDERVETDPPTGLPLVLKAYVVHENPTITVIPNFLSDSEIDHLLELAKDFWVPSVVGTGVYKTNNEAKDLANKPSKNRTSYSCMLRSGHTFAVRCIEQRLATLAGMDVDYLERLNMVRYAPGELFNEHHDGRFRPMTVFIYLNDVAEGDGGETYFPYLGVKVQPRKGCAVMWSNVLQPSVEDKRTIHAGLPPKSGMKFGVNCFFNDKRVRQWDDVDSDLDEQEEGPSLGKPPASERWRIVDPDTLAKEAAGAPAALQPGQLCAFTVSREPKISVIPGFLTADEAAALMACALPEDERRPLSRELIETLEHRMAVAAGMPLEHMDPLRVARCEPSMTPDGQVLAHGQYSQRFGARVVYIFLNTVSEGGELRFPRLGMQVKVAERCAVVWRVANEQGADDPRAVHQGRPPKREARFCAVGVFRASPVRSAVPVGSEE